MMVISSMDLPTTDVNLRPEKIEDEKVGGLLFHCHLFDIEVVYKVAEMLLPGLATACVDNTSGDLFRTPGSVAVELRKEMIEYLTQRSELFVAESVILEDGPEGEVSDHPFDITSYFVDEFTSLRRNLFSWVSGWLLSEKREDKIDDFAQEMEMDGFWSLDRREKVAEILLKNVDFKNLFHCSMKFNSAEELANHVYHCTFRSMICQNEGCDARFCASLLEKHDSICPFKIIPCEQNCSDSIMRREMDRHCITVCPMKLVNCPFYAVGCRSAIPQCMIHKHYSEDLHKHLLYILQGIYREASEEDLKTRVEQILQASSNHRLAEAQGVRSLTFSVKDIEVKLGPLEVSSAENNAKKGDNEEINIKTNGSEQSTQTSNMVNSSAKASAVINKDSAENDIKKKVIEEDIYIEIKDAEDSNLKIKGNAESTETNIANLSDKEESSATNEDSAENNIKNNDIEDNRAKDNEGSMQTLKMENKGSAENNVKNKDIEIGNLQESIPTSKVENLSDKTEVSAMKKDGAECNGIRESGHASNPANSSDETEG